MKQKVTAVFDIGKTNKKIFLFDENFQEVHKEYIRFDETVDEDGYPCEDIDKLKTWIVDTFDTILKADKYEITSLNFSTYGASFVHIGYDGEVVAPLYNYTKPYDAKLEAKFYRKYGPIGKFCQETGSSKLGNLNSGLQIYLLKYQQPELFKKIKYSLHLPQFVSYLFTGIPLSEYTSIGCHTALWDYKKQDYHTWVYEEGINEKLPSIVSTESSINMNYKGHKMKIGVGIHDSSSALVPYLRSSKKPFLLVSTGTWAITLNPFSDGILSASDLKADCQNNMRINGEAVKAARLFLGNEYKLQIAKLTEHYKVPHETHRTVKFSKRTFKKLNQNFKPHFAWESLKDSEAPKKTTLPFESFEEAYHQMMQELVKLQVKNINMAKGKAILERIYIDGGFSDNDIYIKLLSHYLKPMELKTTDSSLGSALGAAIAISDISLNPKFLKKNYSLKKHKPVKM
ncbi:FGGY family carbohydrate kinase [uncultured Arcticibacterium sp.]|uniref:FGGY-family carbohydrate kinase n=1 Tax=uncultured Arcticibacterium sp. TaxID=2173042 RepID=UPI0030F7AD31